MTELELEVREVLKGNTIPMENGHLRTMGAEDYRLPNGVSDGGAAVRFFGVRQRSTVLSSELSEKALLKAVRKSMHKVGRTLVILSQPDTAACLIRYVTTRPAVVTVRYINGVPVATAWSAKGMTGWISNIRALNSLEKQLPPEIVFNQLETAPADDKITRKQFRKDVREVRREIRGEEIDDTAESAKKEAKKESKQKSNKKSKKKSEDD